MSTQHQPVAPHDAIAALIRDTVAPQAQSVDQGHYPRDTLQALGQCGAFDAALPAAAGGQGAGLATQIDIIAQLAQACGATAFLAWCQAACAWYLLQSANAAARERYLAPVAHGRILAGTGMSNTVKHLAGIERISLRAKRAATGFRVTGALPWVSNLGPDHLLVAAASLEEGGYLMFVVPPGAPELTLRPCPAFAGMEGTGTFNVRLKDVHIPPEDVLAGPDEFAAYITRIKPGFLLTQIGLGLGLIRASLDTIHTANQRLGHVNIYLDHQSESLERDWLALSAQTARLADQGQGAPSLDVLRARARASELTLCATQSAALHAGAAGYLMSHPAQRRLREALFVAIVTPALKHLRKEIHDIEQRQAA